jgi:hypothetical protein
VDVEVGGAAEVADRVVVVAAPASVFVVELQAANTATSPSATLTSAWRARCLGGPGTTVTIRKLFCLLTVTY